MLDTAWSGPSRNRFRAKRVARRYPVHVHAGVPIVKSLAVGSVPVIAASDSMIIRPVSFPTPSVLFYVVGSSDHKGSTSLRATGLQAAGVDFVSPLPVEKGADGGDDKRAEVIFSQLSALGVYTCRSMHIGTILIDRHVPNRAPFLVALPPGAKWSQNPIDCGK